MAKNQVTSKGANRAAVYVRISRDSAARGLGVERQVAMCLDLAKRLGASVIRPYYEDNDVSAKRDARTGLMKSRPGFARLMADVKAGRVDMILCQHQDRLVRELRELVDIVDVLGPRDVPVHAATAGTYDLSTASGKMTAYVLGAAAAYESEQKGERVAIQKRQARSAGAWTGGQRPYGYRCVRTATGDASLEPVEAEAVEVRAMVAGVIEGKPLARIAADLNARGIATPARKGPWRATQVRQVIMKPLIAGLRTHEGEVIGSALWAPIVDRGTWERALYLLTRPERKKGSSKRRWLLSGLTTNEAGEYHKVKVSGDANVAYYQAPGVSYPAEVLDGLVWDAILAWTDAHGTGRPEGASDEADEAVAEIATLEAELAAYGEALARKELDIVTVSAATRTVNARIAELRSSLKVEGDAPAVLEVLERPGGLRKAVEAGAFEDFQDRRAVVLALVERITIRGRWTGSLSERFDVAWK